MPRPAKRTKNPPVKTSSRLRQAASQVAVDAAQVRQDLNKLLKSLEDLSVEALREVASRALALIDEKNGDVKRSLIGGVVGGAGSIENRSRGCSADRSLPRKSGGRKGGLAAPGRWASGRRTPLWLRLAGVALAYLPLRGDSRNLWG